MVVKACGKFKFCFCFLELSGFFFPKKWFFVLSCFWPHREAYGSLIPQPGMESTPPALQVWTTREVPPQTVLLGKRTGWSRPPWPGAIVTICVRCCTTGGPGREHGTNMLPPTGRVWEKSKGDAMCPTTSQNPSLWHPSWLNKRCTTRKDHESEWLAKHNPKLISSP